MAYNWDIPDWNMLAKGKQMLAKPYLVLVSTCSKMLLLVLNYIIFLLFV